MTKMGTVFFEDVKTEEVVSTFDVYDSTRVHPEDLGRLGLNAPDGYSVDWQFSELDKSCVKERRSKRCIGLGKQKEYVV
jgi:hypothetical protein